MAAMLMIKSIPLFFSTTFKHYVHGPPQPSWNLKLHLTIRFIQTMFNKPMTIERSQGSTLILANEKLPPFSKMDKIIISNEYIINAQKYIEKLVEPYNIVIDPIWKSPKNDGMYCELIMNKDWNEDNDWEKEKIIIYLHGGAYFTGGLHNIREMCCELSKESGARVIAIKYRLAPQQPFPAALCDALSAYLYLTNPPNDSGLKPYKPEQIFFCGDSAGGGLSISLGLALRDLGLPLPAGIIGWSPWVDLTHSMPSFLDPIMDKTDILPPKLGFMFSDNPNSIAHQEFRSRTKTIIENIKKHPEIKLIGDDSLKRIGNQSINYYIVNEGLGIPYVSPMLAESLGGLPPILVTAGNVERLRDEAIYFTYRAANPEKYRLPTYETDFDNSQFKSPTKVTFELYDEMFHAFQYLKFCKLAGISIKRTADFINNVSQDAISSNNLNSFRISHKGEVRNLDESSIENVLKWDKVGVYPGV